MQSFAEYTRKSKSIESDIPEDEEKSLINLTNKMFPYNPEGRERILKMIKSLNKRTGKNY